MPARSGVPGPGESSTPAGSQPADLGHGDLVVAPHVALDAELAEVLDQVVDERVVVVDHEYAHGVSPVSGLVDHGVSVDLDVIEGQQRLGGRKHPEPQHGHRGRDQQRRCRPACPAGRTAACARSIRTSRSPRYLGRSPAVRGWLRSSLACTIRRW